MHKLNSKAALVALAAAAMVSACGGDDDGDNAVTPPQGTDIPASALASTSGLVDYVNSLIGASSDSAEPVVVGDAVLPTSDTTE